MCQWWSGVLCTRTSEICYSWRGLDTSRAKKISSAHTPRRVRGSRPYSILHAVIHLLPPYPAACLCGPSLPPCFPSSSGSFRFCFLTASNPNIQYCVREGCQAIETERHLFFDCDFAAQLWSHIHRLLDPFFTQKASWVDIVLGARRRLRDEWVPDAAVVHDIWHIIRAVTLHFVWFDRNRCLLDGRRSTPTAPALMVIFSTSSAHLRHLLRCQYDHDLRTALQRAIAALTRDPSFGMFLIMHPAALVVRHRADSF